MGVESLGESSQTHVVLAPKAGQQALYAEELLLCTALLAAAVLCSYTIQRYGFHYVPASDNGLSRSCLDKCVGNCNAGAAMLLGMGWGLVLRMLPTEQSDIVGKGLSFEPESFFYGLLPPIIYAAGFNLKQKAFFRNFGSILMFAVAGTIISTFVFGIATYMLYATGMVCTSPPTFTDTCNTRATSLLFVSAPFDASPTKAYKSHHEHI
eukprot:1729227-Pyramimonas_sp.AAC.1